MRKATLLILLIFCICITNAAAESSSNVDADSLALKGYDPVSYHQEKPVKGSEDIVFKHENINYRFANVENLEKFKSDPQQYIPAYGGWCAWAMLEGQKVDVDPQRYKVVNGTTYLFYNTFFVDTLKKWNKAAEAESEKSLIDKADEKWMGLAMPSTSA